MDTATLDRPRPATPTPHSNPTAAHQTAAQPAATCEGCMNEAVLPAMAYRYLPARTHGVPDTAAVPAPRPKNCRSAVKIAAPNGGTILTAHRHYGELFAPTTAGACLRRRTQPKWASSARQATKESDLANSLSECRPTQHRHTINTAGTAAPPKPRGKTQGEHSIPALPRQQIRWQLPAAGRLAAPFDRPRIFKSSHPHTM